MEGWAVSWGIQIETSSGTEKNLELLSFSKRAVSCGHIRMSDHGNSYTSKRTTSRFTSCHYSLTGCVFMDICVRTVLPIMLYTLCLSKNILKLIASESQATVLLIFSNRTCVCYWINHYSFCSLFFHTMNWNILDTTQVFKTWKYICLKKVFTENPWVKLSSHICFLMCTWYLCKLLNQIYGVCFISASVSRTQSFFLFVPMYVAF